MASTLRLNQHFYTPRTVSSIYTGRKIYLDGLKQAFETSISSSECFPHSQSRTSLHSHVSSPYIPSSKNGDSPSSNSPSTPQTPPPGYPGGSPVSGKNSPIHKRFVIFGLGGSGKTQFCCKFASDNKQR